MDWREWVASPQYNAGVGGASAATSINKQNEAQYQSTMAGYGAATAGYAAQTNNLSKLWGELYNQQQGFGQFQLDQVNRQYDAQSAAQQASLMSRGLGNTTVLDSMTRGINYDRANASLNVQDQILQRQNQIRQAQLGYLGDAYQYQAGLSNQANAYAGNYGAQQASISAQLASQYQQQQDAWNQMQNQQTFQAQLQQGQNNFAQNMQQRQFQQQDYIQDKYGYYADGGSVEPQYGQIPPPQGTDTVPARLTPGEFVLSKDMIHALETGDLDRKGILYLIKSGR